MWLVDIWVVFSFLLLLWCFYEHSSMCFLVYRLRIYYVYVLANFLLFLTFKSNGFIWVIIVPRSGVLDCKTFCPSGNTTYLPTGRMSFFDSTSLSTFDSVIILHFC